MNCLLDTHIVLWWLDDDRRLPDAARDVIADGANEIYLSAVVIAEIAIKTSHGKLTMPVPASEIPTVSGFPVLPLSAAHAARLELLPWHHRDPFDRMLIAQVQHEGFTFVTADERCRAYDVTIL